MTLTPMVMAAMALAPQDLAMVFAKIPMILMVMALASMVMAVRTPILIVGKLKKKTSKAKKIKMVRKCPKTVSLALFLRRMK